MHKDKKHYETSKIVVDFYHPQHNDTVFVCSCFTPGTSPSIEPEYLVKTVTYDELKEHIADGFGKVNISFYCGEDYITFDKYLSGLSCYHIERHCEDVINKREARTHLFDPAAYLKQLNTAA